MKFHLFAVLCLCLAAACNPALPATATTTLLSPTAAATATIPPTPAPPTIEPIDIPNAAIVYYDISGSTESELRAQLDALGPTGYDGYKGDATTNWFISWDWPGYGNSVCDLSAATVSLTVEVTFPRWTPPEDAGTDLVDRWAGYTRRLAEHERGHVDFVAANYESVTDAIKAATCETAEAAAQEALASIRQHDTDYDAETDHGATQGAVFP
jgi:predicted secreted Zn-dependent protease